MLSLAQSDEVDDKKGRFYRRIYSASSNVHSSFKILLNADLVDVLQSTCHYFWRFLFQLNFSGVQRNRWGGTMETKDSFPRGSDSAPLLVRFFNLTFRSPFSGYHAQMC